MNEPDSHSNGRKSKLPFVAGIMAVTLSIALVAVLFAERRARLRDETRTRQADVQAGPRVRTAMVSLSPETRSIVLVGDATPYASVTLYSKVSGFLHEIRVDRGDHVSSGDILAIIESPELDRQYDAAVADAKNKRADAERSRVLVATEVISQQDAERTETAAKVAEATAESLKAQKEYKIIRAPFTGTITARYADPGALMQAATSAQTTALPVLAVTETDRLRVFVYPDQSVAAFIRVGDRAKVWDVARPDVRVVGTVTRTSGELDAKTRTLLVEIDLDNREGKVLPGSTVRVALEVQAPAYVQVPAAALLIRGGKPFVGVITEDRKVSLRQVSIYESDGRNVKLVSGLSEGVRVGLSLGVGISDGDRVQIADNGKGQGVQ